MPEAALIQASDGNFYGTTTNGGTNAYGTIFRLTATGILTTLHFFTGGDDGKYPLSSLVQSSDGNFYGTTEEGGVGGYGTIFQLTPTGNLTTVHAFTGTDGAEPVAGLIQAVDGSFYGTTSDTGVGAGTVFRLSVNYHGTLQFSAAGYDAAENASAATVSVCRMVGGAGAVTVAYATGDGSAVAGTDYTAVSGTLVWADGDMTAKTFMVPILDRHLSDGTTRTLAVALLPSQVARRLAVR